MSYVHRVRVHLPSALMAGIAVAIAAVLASPMQASADRGVPSNPPPGIGQSPIYAASPIVCKSLQRKRVPQARIDEVLEDPSQVSGWNKLANPNRAESPYNTRKRSLTVRNPNSSYHPMFNGLVFRRGCR